LTPNRHCLKTMWRVSCRSQTNARYVWRPLSPCSSIQPVVNVGSGSVQLSIVLISLFSGDRLNVLEWTGFLAAVAGFVYLVLPGVTAPSLAGFSLMMVAGIAWGVYTLIGRMSQHPLSDTTVNFARTLPFAAVLGLTAVATQSILLSPKGLLLAVISGSLTSGVGYAIWYKALAGLSAPQSGVVQLFAPVIAAFGGFVFLSEAVSLRLFLSAIMILGGIGLLFLGRYRFTSLHESKK